MATIIGSGDGGDKEVEYTRKRMIHIAKEHAKHNQCRNCGGKELKAVVLHEFGDPYIPSSIHLFCPTCKKNTPFMVRDIADAKRYAEYVMKENVGEKKQQAADAMINDMIRQAKAAVHAEKQAKSEKIVKDEAGQIIANPEDVRKIDEKKKKK